MHLRKLWLLAGVVFTGLVLVATGSARQTSSKAAGTMVIGLEQNPQRLTYYIKKNAYWNDGGKKVPVTAQDFVFTWKVVMNPKIQVLGTTGFDQIKSARIINKKTVQFTFKTPFAGY